MFDAGFTVGYGASYVTVRPTTIATVPVGYADGYFRSFSNKGFILLHGKKVPIVGRICHGSVLWLMLQAFRKSENR